MRLGEPLEEDLRELRGWFPDPRALLEWGGPRMRWPMGHEAFIAGLQLRRVTTRSLRDDAGGLAGFGQYYRKLDRCHLARIAVRPELRRTGLGRRLVRLLMSEGSRRLGVRSCSLYVLGDNRAAVTCYRACGFEFAADPEPIPALPDIRFMVAGPAALARFSSGPAGSS